MHSSAKTFLTAVLAVASAAVMALVLADRSAPSERHAVVQLERVVVEGKRAPQTVAQLPRVVIVGKRDAAGSLDGQHLARLDCATAQQC
ncbi:MAG TPA: hypothetical protein VJN44_14710 [Roseateles sp.]|nr:hypothetical protein [Roseateles sp.]